MLEFCLTVFVHGFVSQPVGKRSVFLFPNSSFLNYFFPKSLRKQSVTHRNHRLPLIYLSRFDESSVLLYFLYPGSFILTAYNSYWQLSFIALFKLLSIHKTLSLLISLYPLNFKLFSSFKEL